MRRSLVRFALVGSAGFVADSLVFFLLNQISDNLLLNRLLAFWFAAFCTWLGNRYFTFDAGQQRAITQWLKHWLSCHFSGGLNIAVFYLMSEILGLYTAFVFGVLVGTISNYMLSRYLVFVSDGQKKTGAVQHS